METNMETTTTTEGQIIGNDALPPEEELTVSGGDVIIVQTESVLSNEILAEIQKTNEYLEEMTAEPLVVNEAVTIWNKPLADYTVVESLDLIFLLVILGVIIFKAIGGIIQCKV